MPAPNEQIRLFAARLCDVIERELGPMMLDPADQVGVLLAAAHGRSRVAQMSPEKLSNLAAFIFRLADEGRAPVTRSLDFEVKDLPMKIFKGMERK